MSWFKEVVVKCCKSCKYDDDEMHYFKAQVTLDKELDIEKIVKNVRLLRNAIKFLTTRRERYLVKM